MKKKKIPQRVCVGCQQLKNKKDMVRIVRTPTNEIIIDSIGKKAGRGAYVCPSKECLTKAIEEKRLERALKSPIDTAVYEALKENIGHA